MKVSGQIYQYFKKPVVRKEGSEKLENAFRFLGLRR